ncbi:MAG: hypothetical protein EXR98_15370 [Gemmataceae bacterium]|nr:hypothetical protein [Gemmataceae bacterium]
MNPHELVLLSPYKFPAQYAMTLADEDMAAWLNGYTALWHPALLWQAKGPPRCEATYDHETPKAGHIYALPETPPTYLPEDWEERVRQAGALMFKTTADRETTLANLKAALIGENAPALGWKAGLDLSADELGPFFGLAWGQQMLASLSEAMEHENLLDQDSFWSDVQNAVALLAGIPYTPSPPPTPSEPDPQYYVGESPDGFDPSSSPLPPGEGLGVTADASDPSTFTANPATEEGAENPETPAPSTLTTGPSPTGSREEEGLHSPEGRGEKPDWREPLRTAAGRLLSAREVLYPVAIHLLDVSFLDETTMAMSWPAGFEFGVITNFIAATSTLEKMAEQEPKRFEQLQTAVQNDLAEVCGGSYVEREDPLLPLDSQLWNLRHGLDRAKELLGVDIRIYARKRFGFHPQMPLLLSSNGLVKALFLTFDENSAVPNYSNLVVSWPSPDGKQVDAFVRPPKYADSVETFFNLGHTWFKTTREDHTATIFLLHRDKPTAIWHRDLMELARLAPLLGEWTTFSRYLSAVMPGEYPSTMTADDFHFDFLSERVTAHSEEPVSVFPRHLRTRRRIDACWTYAALHRSLSGVRDTLDIDEPLRAIEKQAECTLTVPAELDELENRVAAALAERLQSRAEPNMPGYMILNPCGFARRAVLELDGGPTPLPIGGIVKACQIDGGKMRTVIEIPALGFAWLPREGPRGTPAMTTKFRGGDPQTNTIRNDFFEAEVDPASGGLKAIRDHKTRMNRLGQMLVFNPGSRMVAKEIKVTSTGPALGEIVTEGVLLGEQDQVLANFRQRLRLWVGRPLLEMRIEITPQQPPAGYGWHAYFGARFAWRDERAMLIRGFNGMGYITNHPRPQTPDYLDIRTPPISTTILTGGLSFHQKQGGRMVDVIMIPEGEKATVFELAIAFDRDVPAQTAWGYASPLAIVPTTKGPPHIGASGWLFHIDASNLLLTRMTPGRAEGRKAPGDAAEVEDAITARFLECANYSGLAEFRCVRDPQRATVLNAQGQFMVEANRSGDTVHLEVTPNDLVHVQVEFSVPQETKSEPEV